MAQGRFLFFFVAFFLPVDYGWLMYSRPKPTTAQRPASRGDGKIDDGGVDVREKTTRQTSKLFGLELDWLPFFVPGKNIQ